MKYTILFCYYLLLPSFAPRFCKILSRYFLSFHCVCFQADAKDLLMYAARNNQMLWSFSLTWTSILNSSYFSKALIWTDSFESVNKQIDFSTQMYEFLEREMQYMNINGSPFVCLLCRGSVYETPAQLQLHLAASHGADKGVTHCALCEVKFRPPVVATGDEALRTMATIYQRHLMTEHLPSLELTGKLLYMNPHLIPSDIVSSAPADDIAYRSYRLVK